MLPDLETLRCFEAAATHLNFRRAARSVSLSPAALGERVRRLEERLGVRLFARTTRRVVLTADGVRALAHARPLLDAAQRFEGAVRDTQAELAFELTLGTRYELGLSWITPSLSLLESNRPHRKLHLFFGDSPDLLFHLKEGALDCAVTSSRAIPSGFEIDALHDESYVFVASARLLRRRPLESPRHAQDHVLLDIAPDLPLFRYFVDAWHGDVPWVFSQVAHLGTIGAIRIRLLEGKGVAVLPRYFVAPDLEKGRLVALQPEIELKSDAFRLLWRRGHRHDAELRRLASELRAIPLR